MLPTSSPSRSTLSTTGPIAAVVLALASQLALPPGLVLCLCTAEQRVVWHLPARPQCPKEAALEEAPPCACCAADEAEVADPDERCDPPPRGPSVRNSCCQDLAMSAAREPSQSPDRETGILRAPPSRAVLQRASEWTAPARQRPLERITSPPLQRSAKLLL